MTDAEPGPPVSGAVWWHHHGRGETDCILQRIEAALYETNRKLDQITSNEEKIMASQDDINAAVAEDSTLLADLTTQTAAVAAAQAAFATEIATLTAAGVDTSGLVSANEALAAAQAPLDAAVSALTAASEPPAPPA